MAFSVNEFRSNLVGDGARPTLFDVTITGAWATDLAGLNFMAKATSLPASTIGFKALSYFGHDVQFAGDRTFADWTITVINDENFKIRNAFEVWMNAIDQNDQSGSIRKSPATASPASYVGQGLVQQYGKTGDVIKKYSFYNIWPTELAAITVDWDTKDDIETFDVTLKYDYYHALTGAGKQLTT